MSMSLVTNRKASEDCFDDLFGDCRSLVRSKVLELHSTEEDDSVYIFIVWAKNLDVADRLFEHLKANAGYDASVKQLNLGVYSITEVL